MNVKIKNYIDLLFKDVPNTSKAKDLKEEMLSNANDRYEDYIAQGKSDNEAYGLAVSSIGDVDDLLQDLMPSEMQVSEIGHYRKRNAMIIAISVMMYIFCPIPVILSSINGNPITGLVWMFSLVAIATGMLIYSSMTTPREVKHYNDSMESKKWEDVPVLTSRRNRSLCKTVKSLSWTIFTVIYFVISFSTFAWHITWIIWLVASVVDRIIVLSFEMKDEKENEF